MKKITITTEIINAMIFLGIPPEKFSELKNSCGGLDGLYEFIYKKLIS